MKFTKTAAALALAGIAAAPLAQAEPVVTLSGSIGINLGSDDSDATDGKWTMSGDDSTLNIAATDTLNNGLTGYGNYRLDSALSGSSTGGDAIHIGVKGDFGDIRIGEVSNAIEYGQMAGDILSDVGSDQNGGISYTGSFGNVGVGLNFSPSQNQDTIGAGVKFNAAGFGIGIGVGDQNDASRMSVGASYGIGGATVALAFKDLDTYESIGAKVSWSVGDIGLGLTFEANQGDVAAQDDSKIRLDASYGLGGGWAVSSRVNMLSVGDSAVDDTGAAVEDKTDYRVQVSKSF